MNNNWTLISTEKKKRIVKHPVNTIMREDGRNCKQFVLVSCMDMIIHVDCLNLKRADKANAPKWVELASSEAASGLG